MHKCTFDDIKWDTYPDENPYYYVGGLGETLERNGVCKVCGKKYREVYTFSCYIDDEKNVVTDL